MKKSLLTVLLVALLATSKTCLASHRGEEEEDGGGERSLSPASRTQSLRREDRSRSSRATTSGGYSPPASMRDPRRSASPSSRSKSPPSSSRKPPRGQLQSPSSRDKGDAFDEEEEDGEASKVAQSQEGSRTRLLTAATTRSSGRRKPLLAVSAKIIGRALPTTKKPQGDDEPLSAGGHVASQTAIDRYTPAGVLTSPWNRYLSALLSQLYYCPRFRHSLYTADLKPAAKPEKSSLAEMNEEVALGWTTYALNVFMTRLQLANCSVHRPAVDAFIDVMPSYAEFLRARYATQISSSPSRGEEAISAAMQAQSLDILDFHDWWWPAMDPNQQINFNLHTECRAVVDVNGIEEVVMDGARERHSILRVESSSLRTSGSDKIQDGQTDLDQWLKAFVAGSVQSMKLERERHPQMLKWIDSHIDDPRFADGSIVRASMARKPTVLPLNLLIAVERWNGPQDGSGKLTCRSGLFTYPKQFTLPRYEATVPLKEGETEDYYYDELASSDDDGERGEGQTRLGASSASKKKAAKPKKEVEEEKKAPPKELTYRLHSVVFYRTSLDRYVVKTRVPGSSAVPASPAQSPGSGGSPSRKGVSSSPAGDSGDIWYQINGSSVQRSTLRSAQSHTRQAALLLYTQANETPGHDIRTSRVWEGAARAANRSLDYTIEMLKSKGSGDSDGGVLESGEQAGSPSSPGPLGASTGSGTLRRIDPSVKRMSSRGFIEDEEEETALSPGEEDRLARRRIKDVIEGERAKSPRRVRGGRRMSHDDSEIGLYSGTGRHSQRRVTAAIISRSAGRRHSLMQAPLKKPMENNPYQGRGAASPGSRGSPSYPSYGRHGHVSHGHRSSRRRPELSLPPRYSPLSQSFGQSPRRHRGSPPAMVPPRTPPASHSSSHTGSPRPLTTARPLGSSAPESPLLSSLSTKPPEKSARASSGRKPHRRPSSTAPSKQPGRRQKGAR